MVKTDLWSDPKTYIPQDEITEGDKRQEDILSKAIIWKISIIIIEKTPII